MTSALAASVRARHRARASDSAARDTRASTRSPPAGDGIRNLAASSPSSGGPGPSNSVRIETGTIDVETTGDAGGESGCRLQPRQRLFDHDGRLPAAGAMGIDDGFHADQPRSERAGRNKQRGRAADTFLRQIEHPPGPGERPASRIVDGDAGASGLVGRQHIGEDIEQLCRRCRIALRELDGGADAITRAAIAPRASALPSNWRRNSVSTRASARRRSIRTG